MFILNFDLVASASVGLLALSLVLLQDPDGLDFRRREVAAARRSIGTAQRSPGRPMWSRRH